MSAVRLQQISHRFGSREILRDLDLEIDAGEYVVLLGPSGCGKTTTLRIIAGLQIPDAGEVLIGGVAVDSVPPRERDVAMVFQQDGLYPHLTVSESIEFALRGRCSSDERRSRVAEAVELTRIDEILDRYPGTLSGGELRRAAIAKAIARRASVRLLDEPLSALDASARHLLQDDLLRWHGAVPGTTIHVTHDGQEAMRMADRIAVIDQGQVAQFGSPSALYARPASVAVARAIGVPPINLVEASVAGGEIRARDGQVTIDTKLDGPDRDLLVGFRPEAISLDQREWGQGARQEGPGAEAGGLTVRGRVTRQQIVQRDVHLSIGINGGQLRGVVPPESTDDNLEGTETGWTVQQRELHLFDAETGRRIDASQGG